jgi:hypothetical protein
MKVLSISNKVPYIDVIERFWIFSESKKEIKRQAYDQLPQNLWCRQPVHDYFVMAQLAQYFPSSGGIWRRT